MKQIDLILNIVNCNSEVLNTLFGELTPSMSKHLFKFSVQYLLYEYVKSFSEMMAEINTM